MLLVIDNQSSYIKKFKRNYLADQNFKFLFYDHNEPLKIPDKLAIKGIILSGGKGTPYEPLNLTTNFVAVITYDVPILAFCLGHEILAVANGGQIKRMVTPQLRKELVYITKPEDPIFKGLNKTAVLLQKKHHHHVVQLPPDYIVLAHSEHCPYEIIRHKTKPVYSFQSHPEVSGQDGLLMIENFLKMCGLIDEGENTDISK